MTNPIHINFKKMATKIYNDEALSYSDKLDRIEALYKCIKKEGRQLDKWNKKLKKKFDMRFYLKRLGILNRIKCAYLGTEQEINFDISQIADDLIEFFKPFD